MDDAGCQRIFFEKATGTSTTKREELKQAMVFLQDGDTLIVTKIDRLARSIIDLNNIIKELNDKGVSVSFLKENMEFKAGTNGNSLKVVMVLLYFRASKSCTNNHYYCSCYLYFIY